jgi:predicted dehydrogenase
MSAVRLVTLAPGHFHAALIQKQMLPEIDRTVHVYAPLDTDLVAHVGRIASFNSRTDRPTSWQLEVHASDDWRERFARERPGNVAILSGRNNLKLEWMRLAVDAGMHVLADKPWIFEPGQFAALRMLIDDASKSGLILHDVMTERHEITSILQREIVNDPDLFGAMEPGSDADPAITMESIHYLKKQVAGAPLRRPGWFFDITQEGEALADVGTHLVDLVLWTLFQTEPIDYLKDVRILDGRRWPTILQREQFQTITGLADYPNEVRPWLDGDRLNYYCNNQVNYSVRGVHVRLDVLWDYEAAAGGGDTHNAVFRGSLSSAEVRQTGGQPAELFVVPRSNQKAKVAEALAHSIARWQRRYPGIKHTDLGDEWHIAILEAYRIGHEAHFAEVTAEFIQYLQGAKKRPDWETPNLLAKYFTTTHGVAAARGTAP